MIVRILFWACWVRAAVAFSPHGHSWPRPAAEVVSKRSSGNCVPQRRYRRLDTAHFLFGGIELSGLLYDSTSTAFDAWEWTNGMGAPSALVAGAVLVTLSESRERTWPRKSDGKKTRFLKQSMRFLLLIAFAMEVRN
jgi:hypothetical protein